MRIDWISVSNFATYEKEELDLRRLGRTISVFGSTGVGKTTFFIDALTFALYGKAYGQEDKESAKWALPPEGSVAEVDLEFTVDEKTYTVTRKVWRTRPSEAQMSLVEQGRRTTLALGVREVDRKVEEIVGFDHPTFLNTVLVRQGDVAALINLDPKGRREIFLRAFNIDYTKHKERARILRDQAYTRLEQLRQKKKDLEEAIDEKPELTKKLNEAVEEVKEMESEMQKLEEELERTSKEKEKANSEYNSIKAELKQYVKMEEDLKRLKEERKVAERQLKEAEELASKKSELEKERVEVENLSEAYEKASEWVKDLKNLNDNLEQLTKQRDKLAKKAEKKDEVEDKLKDARNLAKQLPNLREQLSAKKTAYEALLGELRRLEGSLNTVKKSLQLLEEAGEEVATCPVCRSPLTRERLQETKTHLQDEIKALEGKISEHKPRSENLNSELKALEQRLTEYERQAAKLESLEEQMNEILEAEEELKQMNEKIDELNQRKKTLEERCTELIGYIPTTEQLDAKRKQLKARAEEIRKNLERIAKAEEKIDSLKKRLSEIQEEEEKLEKELERIKPMQRRADELDGRIRVLEEGIRSLQSTVRSVEERLVECKAAEKSVKDRLGEILAKEEELQEVNKSITSLEKEHQAYELLYGEVFHEKGFPLALLQDFLKDVELYAGEYLSRFLPDKSIRIEADETGRVRIDVVDGTTARELATYSGGETVLIGFAIRLGVAKAVAERSVAHAPRFLIIDEGFGPLSREFKEEVIKTLSELSQDYEKIIVISHVDEVKESQLFATQIQVTKDSSGHSHLNIVKW
jgi:exonuclease SbcC